MLKSFSNKAIATKARAMYGARVTPADYEELLKKRSVGETAAYLRDNTHYHEVLTQLDPAAIHRGQLENLLRSLRYIQYQRLIAFDFGQQELYQYIYAWDESRQIIALLRFLASQHGKPEAEQYNFRYDRRLARRTSYNLEKMVEVKSYRELIDFFGDSPYGRILRHFPLGPDGQVNLMGCEQAISTWYYRRQLEIVDRELRGEDREAMRQVFYRHIDQENISQTYRLKRFFHSPPDFIRNSLLPFKTPMGKVVEQMIEAENLRGLHSVLEHAGLARGGTEDDTDFIETTVQRLRFRQSKKDLRGSGVPPVVLHAYITQLEVELGNIINIIESVRYGLPPDEIRSMLVM